MNLYSHCIAPAKTMFFQVRSTPKRSPGRIWVWK